MPLFGLLKENSIKLNAVQKVKKKPQHVRASTLKKTLKMSLGKGISLREAIKCPKGENFEEWIAMNVVEVFNSIRYCFCYIADECHTNNHPMSAGPKFTYLWCDEETEQFSKPTEVTAAQYFELLCDWVARLMDDESIFPTTTAGVFGKKFLPTVKSICNRLSRIFFHIYHHHWKSISDQNVVEFVNTSFKHFYFFVSEFQLVKKDKFEPVQELVAKLEQEK